ncbi:MAG TPA: hypothetical protein VIX63_01950 [Vicinamibacterales bacterium]
MNQRVLATVIRQMEEWCDANRASQPGAVIEAVAFWARTLRREVPLGGMLAAAAGVPDRAAAAARREQTIAETLASLNEAQRSHETTRLALERTLAENWVALRLAGRRPLRRLVRRKGGRLLLYWLTMVAGIAAMVAFALALLPLAWLAERATGSEWAGFAAVVLAASFAVSAWVYSPWSATASYRLAAWLAHLEKNRR